MKKNLVRVLAAGTAAFTLLSFKEPMVVVHENTAEAAEEKEDDSCPPYLLLSKDSGADEPETSVEFDDVDQLNDENDFTDDNRTDNDTGKKNHKKKKSNDKKKNTHTKYAKEGRTLTKRSGVFFGPSGKETYYNLNMSRVISYMKNNGHREKNYWVRKDGVKMFGDYIMVAASLDVYDRGDIVETSLGQGIVCDTGTFAASNPKQLDIATTW